MLNSYFNYITGSLWKITSTIATIYQGINVSVIMLGAKEVSHYCHFYSLWFDAIKERTLVSCYKGL